MRASSHSQIIRVEAKLFDERLIEAVDGRSGDCQKQRIN
jgi:hypothetical protein